MFIAEGPKVKVNIEPQQTSACYSNEVTSCAECCSAR